MNTPTNTANALPLIPPAQAPMSLKQCQDELSRLRDAHHQAIVQFWGSLPTQREPNPQWNGVQRDLYELRRCGSGQGRARISSPLDDMADEIYKVIESQLDDDERKSFKTASAALSDVKAIISEDAETIVVHRLDADHVYGEEEDFLSIDINDGTTEGSDGTSWWYKVHHYEPGPGSREAAHAVPSLYIVGAKNDSGNWSPKRATPKQLQQIQSATEVMESLLASGALPRYLLQPTALPGFPSGQEGSIRELELLQDWLYGQGYGSLAEDNAINMACANANEDLKAIDRQIDDLKRKYAHRLHEMQQTRIGAFLEFHGLALGQEVFNPFTSERGKLVVHGKGHMADLAILQEGREVYPSPGNLMSSIRRKEWIAADVEREEDTTASMNDTPL